MDILILCLFNFVFFYSIWLNPFKLATGEILSTYFPSFISQVRGDKRDYYWLVPNAHPVLSRFYLPQTILSYLCRAIKNLDVQFSVYIFFILSHYVVASIAYYWLIAGCTNHWVALFTSITLTYGAVSLRQQPCLVYTLAWFPFALFANPLVSSFSLGMMLTAGYYPFAIYLTPIAVLAHIYWYKEAWLLLGILIALPQIVTFLKYLPKTIKSYHGTEEAQPWERKFYVGVAPLIFMLFSKSNVWPIIIASGLFSLGVCRSLFPKIKERWYIVLQFGIGWAAWNGMEQLKLSETHLIALFLVQCLDLWIHNRNLLPPEIYSELSKKPSRAFNNKLTRYLEDNLGDNRVAGLKWPLFTGHINKIRTLGYCGSMQNKLMWKWRKSYRHELPEGDSNDLERYRVKFSYSRKRHDWLSTSVKWLWRNANI